MARERSIVTRLKAEVSDFVSGINQASRTLSDFEREQQKMGGAATTTLGRMVQSAKINEREWTQVGRTLLGVGTATAALGVASLKTGVDYNSMRQKATQALTAVTGSTEVAGAQMRALDEYGRNSWLMRPTLIKAQTQMTGFGIETRKVIPYMSALADAVAATGGSNQDFEELARVMGQVQSQGKITARELMQFGIRGVDAAQLIGDAMGKTAGQIREEITAGSLDAGAALDALADGMATRFEGASDLVRLSFSGAVDNLVAGWRDLMAEFAKPLVDPEGGGALVDWVNRIADSLFALKGHVEAMPQWMKTGALAFGVLGTAATVTAGTFMVAMPRYLEFQRNLSRLAEVHPRVAALGGGLVKFGARAAGIAVGLGIAAAATGALVNALKTEAAVKGANALTAELRKLADAGKSAESLALTDLMTQMPELFGRATINAQNLDDVFGKLLNPDAVDRFGESMATVFGLGASYMRDYREIAAEIDDVLVSMLNAGGLDESRAVEFMEGLGYSTEELAEILPRASDALILAADGATELADGTDAAAEAAERAAEKMEAWIGLVESAGASFGGILDAYDAVIDKNDDMALSTAQTMEQWIQELEDQANAVARWKDNYFTALDQIRHEVPAAGQEAHREFVVEMLEAGESGAAALQTFVDGTPAQRAELVAAWQGAGFEIQELLEEGHKPLKLDVDTSKAISDANAMMSDWGREVTETNLSANTDPAVRLARDLMGEWESTTTPTFLDADPGPAVRVFNEETRKWENTTTDTLLSADPGKAVAVFNRETGKWERTTVRTHLGLNTGGAQSTLDAWKSRNSSFTVWANVQTRGSVGTTQAPLGKYHGGKITVPGLNAGGKVPGPRAAYDNVLWPLSSGGRTLTQPLSGGEWVINSAMSQRYDRELGAMNAGSYPVGGSVDYVRLGRMIEAAVERGAERGSARGAASGAALGTESGLVGAAGRSRMYGLGG